MIKDEYFINDYQEGLKTLEDLHFLGDGELTPLLNQLHYHFYNIKKEEDQNTPLGSTYEKLVCFLQESIGEILRKYLLSNKRITQLNFEKNTQKFDLEKWNRVIEVLPTILATVELFDFQGMIGIKLDSRSLVIAGDISNDQDFEENRAEIYSHQRKIIKNNSLLTFRISPSEKPNYSRLTFAVDLSHSNKSTYCIDLKEEQGMILGISNLFEHYKMDEDQKNEMIHKNQKHVCLEITEQLGLIRHEVIPQSLENLNCKKEILYFNFLFRPLSIIIPNRGKIFPTSDIKKLGYTGSGNVITIKQEFEKVFQYRFRYLDFFSLMCE